MKSLSYLFLTTLILAGSCKTSKVDLKQLDNNGEVILSMERTACFGSCPVFEAKLYSNGLLLYNGKMFTQHTGCGYAEVPKAEIAQLLEYVKEAGFFNLENKYPINEQAPSDLPGCHLYIKSGANEKRIEDEGWETPSALTAIQNRVDSLILTKKLHFCDK
ncbi:MAG: DUF6438 domain-containing protein [Bacteroidota bacterium]